MKLFEYAKIEEFGTSLNFRALAFKRWNVIQFALSYNDYSSLPYLNITMGNGQLFGFTLYIWKFGIDLGLIDMNWRFVFDDEKA